MGLVSVDLLFKTGDKRGGAGQNIQTEKKIIEAINKSQPKSKTELIDRARKFVYENSIKEIDSEHQKYAWNRTYVLERLYLASVSKGDRRPHLSCGPRALAMGAVLGGAGFQTRIIHLLSDNFPSVKTHILLEVFSPDTQKWEIHDPDSDSYFINKETRERASIAEMILDEETNFIVVSDRVEEKGWQEKIVGNYFEAAVYDFKSRQNSKSVVIYNPKRLSLEKVFPDENGFTLLEFLKEKYGNPAIILGLNNSTEFESLFYDF